MAPNITALHPDVAILLMARDSITMSQALYHSNGLWTAG